MGRPCSVQLQRFCATVDSKLTGLVTDAWRGCIDYRHTSVVYLQASVVYLQQIYNTGLGAAPTSRVSASRPRAGRVGGRHSSVVYMAMYARLGSAFEHH